MNQVLNQVKRLWSDTGSCDKDFTVEDIKLKKAQNHLREATEALTKASNLLTDLIKSKLH